MRRMLLGTIAGLWIATAAAAQDALPPDPGIEGTIRNQIDAFLADDVAQAFTFASPGIQSMFGTPENFGAMVRNGYPMVWRPADVQFGPLREIGGAPWQQVIVRDASGATHVLDYRMESIDGQWRISAVQILPAPRLSA